MAILSFNLFNWYDASIRYLKEAIDLLFLHTKWDLRRTSYELGTILMKIKKQYIIFHKNWIDKEGVHKGGHWKAHANKVNLGSNICFITEMVL